MSLSVAPPFCRPRDHELHGRAGPYTDDSNINFWELKQRGNNECIIYNKEKIKNVAVGG